ncbi:MAG: thiol-disulfide oxidoreductase DCC family protein [Ferruginibacter sp.]
MMQLMSSQPIILFDGICNLCNRSVQFVIKNDPAGLFKFTPLQGNTGKKILSDFKLSTLHFDSFILFENGKIYTRSTAALLVAKKLKSPVKLLYGFIIVPPVIRNVVYNFIAKNRYRWFGKTDSCMIPSPALQDRFLN